MKYSGPNGPCTCDSGKKYKRCCGPRGGLTQIEYAEEQAYKEERAREYAKKPRRASTLPFITYFAAMADPFIHSRSAPRPSINRKSRRPS